MAYSRETVMDFILNGKIKASESTITFDGFEERGDAGNGLKFYKKGQTDVASQSPTERGDDSSFTDSEGYVYTLAEGSVVSYDGTNDWFGGDFGTLGLGVYTLASSGWSVASSRVASYEVESTEYLINTFDSSALNVGDIVKALGFYEKGGSGAASWKKTGITGVTSQYPKDASTSSSILLYSSNGGEFELVINSDYVNPDSLGAVGDNVNDDTLAFQKTINYAVKQNLIIKPSAGKNYSHGVLSYSMTSNSNRFRLKLNGCVLTPQEMNTTAFYINGNGYNGAVSIEGPGLINGVNLIVEPGVASGSYFDINYIDNLSISGVAFQAGSYGDITGDSAIVVGQCRRVRITNNYFTGWDDHCIYFSGPAIGVSYKCDDVLVSNNTFRSSGGAIRWSRGYSKIAVTGNVFSDVYNAFIASGGNTNQNPGDSVCFTGNMVSSCKSSVVELKYSSGGATISGNLIHDWATESDNSAIVLRGASKVSITGNTIVPRDKVDGEGNISCASCLYIQSATNDNLDSPDDEFLWSADNVVVSGNVMGILTSETTSKNVAIIDMTGSDTNSFIGNSFILSGTTIPYWMNDSGENKYLGDPRIFDCNGTGWGVGTDSAQAAMHVIGDLRVGRSGDLLEYFDFNIVAGSNNIDSYSNVDSAQKLIINSTTNELADLPTAGSVGIRLQVRDADRLVIDQDEIRMLSVPTSSSGLSSGSIWSDAGTLKIV